MKLSEKSVWEGGNAPPVPRQFRPSDYPVSYGDSGFRKLFATIMTCIIVALFVFVFHAVVSRAANLSGLGLYLPFLAIPLVMIAALQSNRTTLVLLPDGIERGGLFGTRRIHRSQIRSWRIRVVKSTKYLDLQISGESWDKWSIQLTKQPDPAFEAWFYDIPNTDVLERQESEEAIRQDVALGGTPQERLDKVAAAKQRLSTIGVALALVLGWSVLFPYPLGLVVLTLALLPWLAVWLALSSSGLYTLGNVSKNNQRPDLTWVLAGPVIPLAVRAGIDAHLLVWTQALAPGAIAGLAVAMLIFMVLPAFAGGAKKYLFVTLGAIVYATAAVMLANSLLDHSQPANYAVAVLQKYQSTGKSHTPYFVVTPWPGQVEPVKLEPPNNLYWAKSVGDTLCVRQYRGALHMPWYTLNACEGG
jgi:hypothetical protein